MNLKLIGATLLALAVVATGAAAAAPGNAPVVLPTDKYEAGQGVDTATDRQGAAAADHPSPPVDLPGPVPDFVSDIHDMIRQHIDGALDGVLGDHVSDMTPGEDPSESAVDQPATKPVE